MSEPIHPRAPAAPDAVAEARKALTCLYIAVEEHVARDVQTKVEAAFAALRPSPVAGTPTDGRERFIVALEAASDTIQAGLTAEECALMADLLWRDTSLGRAVPAERHGETTSAKQLALLTAHIEALDSQLTRLGDGDFVEGYQMKTGAWHRILGIIRGSPTIQYREVDLAAAKAQLEAALPDVRRTVEALERAKRVTQADLRYEAGTAAADGPSEGRPMCGHAMPGTAWICSHDLGHDGPHGG